MPPAAEDRGETPSVTPRTAGSRRWFALLLLVVAGLALVSLDGGAIAGQAVAVSPDVLRDESYCLGCHGLDAKAKKAPAVDAHLLHATAHDTTTCVDCHRDIKTVPHTPPAQRVDCGGCHSEEGSTELVVPGGKKPVAMGTHGLPHQNKIVGLPACTRCHGAHDLLSPKDTRSHLSRKSISETCGSCHTRQVSQYLESVHGQALARGNADIPVCDTCHPEHPRASRQGIAQKGVVATCTACHEDPGLQQQYAVPANRLASYMGSYHGAATELGDSHTANCASCHSQHLILPSKDPRSSVNRKNLPETCGRCHPGAGVHFSQGTIHLQPGPKRDRLVFWVKVGYQIFIVGLMASFIGYIFLDLLARVRGKFGRNGRHRPDPNEPQFERLSLNQRIQHWSLMTSFVALLVTGLPLASPSSEISQRVVTFLGGMGARAIIHRAAAIMLIAIAIYHLFYVLLSRKGYRDFQQLLPGILDARDIVIMLGFYLGFTPVPAQFGRYNFIEKFEYLAVGWGSVVMVGTGAMLWAPGTTLILLPKWTMDVALITHGWEAILAFLAIIIWHMYNVHWNPSIFPMSRVWLTGKIGLREFQENHPLEYDRVIREQKGPAGQEERVG